MQGARRSFSRVYRAPDTNSIIRRQCKFPRICSAIDYPNHDFVGRPIEIVGITCKKMVLVVEGNQAPALLRVHACTDSRADGARTWNPTQGWLPKLSTGSLPSLDRGPAKACVDGCSRHLLPGGSWGVSCKKKGIYPEYGYNLMKPAILYYTVRNYILCYALLYYTILYSTLLYSTLLYYTILYYTTLHYTILYYTILYYTILYYTILYYTILYYTILYYTILYYTILYCL